MFGKLTTTFDLGDFSDEEKATLKGDSPIKRKMNDILKKSRAAAKQDTCFHCGKKVESFCNSHSVPAFCLKNIASNGMLLSFIFSSKMFRSIVGRGATARIFCIRRLAECDACPS